MKGILFKPWKIKFIAEHPDMELQTRRVIKPQPILYNGNPQFCTNQDGTLFGIAIPDKGFEKDWRNIKYLQPRYQVGETVYIKEAYWEDSGDIYFKLDFPNGEVPTNMYFEKGKWKSPLFLPEILARYFPVITDVRAERLQEITEEDAKKEGTALLGYTTQFGRLLGKNTYRWSFEQLWNSINKDYPFESNPFVWVYTFRIK